ncbi:hypothetical protein [Vibrio sp. 10N]|uniref:hypothetical protein n=1 Tax=Vibrio sp. 10N TaxID=3058938 RepID=UPI0028139754|nr:hypothetical protein VB10N_09810 [Vibrio sp. 10N]
MKNTACIVATVAMLILSPSFASANTTAGGEEQWQIVEEDQAPATTSTTTSTSKQSAPKQTASAQKSKSSAKSSSRRGGSSGFKLGMGFDQGLSIVGQINNTVNFAVGNDGIAADYIFNRGSFGGDVPFNWYAGVGGQIKRSDKFGPRIALGVELPFARNWDGYAQLTPNLMFDNSDLKLGIGAGIGVRYSF